MDGPLRVLLVEDDEDDYILARDLLAEAGPGAYALDWAPSYEAGLEAIARGGHDAYLLDYQLGRRTGLDLLREAVALGCRAPLILLTGQGDRAVDLRAMRAGAADYLAKAGMDAANLERALRFAVERKRAEDELRQMRDELERRVAERTAELARANDELRAASRSKDEFLAVLSHELRTPLTPVLVGITALVADPETPDSIRESLEIARRNVELEARLIDDLLDVTRITQGKLRLSREVVDAHPLVRHAVEICRDEIASAGLRLEVDLAAPAHHVHGDPARLQQVVWNLVKNAAKFTPSGGRIAVRSRNVPAPEDARDGDGVGRPPCPRLVVEVEDTGIGIAPEVLPKVFNAFEQGEERITHRFGGLGLGLAISRSLAEAHGGSLSARSDGVGKGATFVVELPTVPAPAAAPDRPSLGPGPGDDRPGRRILLVEDNADTLRVMAGLLRRRGHRVATAASVAEALAVAGRDGPFDLLISDVGLPDGSGLDLMRQVRGLGPGPVGGIALSGYGTEEDRRRSREAGFAAHLTKPIDFAGLEAAIRGAGGTGGGAAC